MRKERMGLGFGLNLLLLLAMVATNLLSFYHLLSISTTSPTTTPSPPVPDHLLRQLSTIRATINHLTRLHPLSPPSTTSTSPSSKSPPSDLLLHSLLLPIATACHDHPDLLHRFMNYTPFSPCPSLPPSLPESLILRGCHPLPRRRCFSRTPISSPPSLPSDPFPSTLPDSSVLWSSYDSSSSSCKSFSCLNPSLGFDMRSESSRFLKSSALDLSVPQFLKIAAGLSSPIRLGLDVGGGTGTFAAQMKRFGNVTVVSTTMNLGAPYSEAVAVRGLVPLHVPLQQRFPVADGTMDIVRCGHAVNRWIPIPALEFLMYDADRLLRGGGFLWIDHFFCKGGDLEKVYAPMIGRLGYKKLKWASANKMDASGLKNGDVYLTALLQKPPLK
ncbi:hypothetical protein QJS10_CPA03g00686 [Acorus calamus]|uniref:Methyltransferase type 11 domain-containing protein n=1 Tax=Acorus calamus TaxID=4465 RepID=A0AAV9F669_ACOCL|nr:hypothetical protein QJS10_CPA03g00686 [Acorus calamus]